MQPTYMRACTCVSFLGKFTSGSRISASCSDLLKLPNSTDNDAADEDGAGIPSLDGEATFFSWSHVSEELFSSIGELWFKCSELLKKLQIIAIIK